MGYGNDAAPNGGNAYASGSGSGQNSGFGTPAANAGLDLLGADISAKAARFSNRPLFDSDIIAQSSAYDPSQKVELAKQGKLAKGKRETVIRKGNGKTWEDPTLLEWDPKWFRLFVGDVSNDVNERTLDEAFGKYPSYCKCKVVKDRLSLKSKYAFIAFSDPEDFLRAWKENDGKYIGNRPIRLSKVRDDKYGSIATTQVSGRKAKELDKLRKNHGKPLDGRPVPW